MEKQIITPRLILQSPNNENFLAFKAFEEQNQAHFSKWESGSTVKKDYETVFNNWKNEIAANLSARFFIFLKDNLGQIIGICNFTQIFYGYFKACYLGYKIDQAFEGQGLMFEALQHAIPYMFEELNLHRIMANYMPSNLRSAKLLDRLGFKIEGYAKDYLLINHQWEDHVLTALTSEQWKKLETSPASSLIREARIYDVESIIQLLFDNKLAHQLFSTTFQKTLAKIDTDPHTKLFVSEINQKIRGVMQIRFTQHLTGMGGQTAYIETFRIDNEHDDLSSKMIQKAIDEAKKNGCQSLRILLHKKHKDINNLFLKKFEFIPSHDCLELGL